VTVADRLWAAYLVGAVAGLAIFRAIAPSAQTPVGLILGLSAVAAVLVGVWIHRPKPALPWYLLAAGQLCFVIGDLIAGTLVRVGRTPAVASPADIFYLAGYPILTLGFALLVARRPLGATWSVLLDGGILAVGLALVAWIAFVDPLIDNPAVSQLQRTLDVAYIIADVATIGLVACLLIGSNTGTVAFRVFMLSVLAMLIGDGLASPGRVSWDTAATVAYFGQYMLWGAAALHPSICKQPVPRSDRDHRITGTRLATLLSACLLAPGILMLQGLAGGHIDFAPIGVGGFVIVALTIASMVDLVSIQTAALDKRSSLEDKLRETSETLRAILDSSPLAIIVVDRHRKVLFWNRAAERLSGYTAAETLGQRSPLVPQDQTDASKGLMPRVLAGASVIAEDMPGRTKDGRPIHVRAHFAPIADESGRILGAISLMEDTSELERLQAELFEARKLESVGRLAGGIAHDFNNILTAIIGFADLSLDEPPGTDITDYVTGIQNAAERAAGLTQQLLAFSRRQMLQPQVLDVNDVVAGVESMLRRLIGEQIELRIELTEGAGCLRADRTQLEQVILNLTLNGRDAMTNGGRLVVHTSHQHYSASSRTRPRDISPGAYVIITVTDNGMGMNSDIRDHIFEPFFTTKGQGRGTGLGLATTYGIIKQSGGSVIVDSEPGHGTIFRIFFPSVPREAPKIVEPRRPSGRRSGRILLVEDEPGLRDIARRVLVRAGFEVLTAAEPGEALTIAEATQGQIDLLLTDVVMPGMRGPELAVLLQSSRPGLRVLLVSGYAAEIVEGHRADVPFLAKPFSSQTLLAAVDDALSPAGPDDAGRAAAGSGETEAREPVIAGR
jgi:PAS domain S-box-containing protein